MAPLVPATLIINDLNTSTEQKKSALRTRIIALGVGLSIKVLVLVIYLTVRIRKRRAARKTLENELPDQAPLEHGVPNNIDPTQVEEVKEGKYNGSSGYKATPDENHGLLAEAEAPARANWHSEADIATEVQRPRSVASFTSLPPRYEEYRPQAVV